MNNRKLLISAGGILMILFVAAFGVLALKKTPAPAAAAQLQLAATLSVPITRDDFTDAFFISSPSTQPELFVDCVDNAYFPLIPGTVYHLEEQTDEGLETVTITVTNETREIIGIQAAVVRDTVRLDGALKEDTFDWYAQDDRANVWYLGEDTKEYEDGEVISTSGSWEAGVDGAVPGFIMLGDPRPGDIYFQEYYEGEAEDMGAVMSLSEPVTVPYGSFENARQTAAYNPLDDQLENKWYAPGIGVVKEIVVDGDASAELVSVTHESSQIILDSSCGDNGGVAFVGTISVQGQDEDLEQLARISAEEAETAALSAVENAKVRQTRLETESGFLVYQVSLKDGRQVTVDAGDAAVLAVSSDDDGGDDDHEEEQEDDDVSGESGAVDD